MSFILEKESKWNRHEQIAEKEEDNEEIWKLKTALFVKKNAVTRPSCKTDRL